MLADIDKINIETLVPHKGIMCFLDKVSAYGEDWVRTESLITKHHLFITEHGLPAWVGIEYMAQSVAALAGIRDLEKGEPVKVGFLLGTRKYTVNTSHFPIGGLIRVKAEEIIWGDNGLGAFNCELEVDNYYAQASLNVFQPSDVQHFLTQGQQ